MSRDPWRRALGDPSIRRYVTGTFLSNIGTWIQRVTMGWLVFTLTGSAGWVGAVAACEVLPSILIAPFAGVLVDRSDRLLLLITGQTCALAQAALVSALAFAGLVELPALIAAAVALGLIDGLNQPARLTIISDVAPPDLISGAIGLNSFGFNTARFIGPVVAGAALSAGGPPLAFALNSVSFVPLIGLLVVLRRRRGAAPARPKLAMRAGIVGGVNHIAGHAVLGPIFLLLIAFGFFARSFFELLPAIAGLWFGASPGALASLTASVGVGAMVGGLWMLGRSGVSAILATALLMPAGAIAVGAAFTAFAGVKVAAYPLLFMMGFFLVTCTVGMQSLIHLTVDPAHRGRVLSLYGLVVRALPAAGALAIGYVGDRIGLRIPLFAAFGAAGAIWAWIWLKRATLYKAVRT
jgi:MFS family permease